MLKRNTLILLLLCMGLMANAQPRHVVLVTPTQTENVHEAWQKTFLEWERLQKEGYARENITVLFAEGHDLYETLPWVHMRYRPDNPNIKVTTAAATVENLQKALKEHSPENLHIWTLQFGTEIPAGAKLRLNDGEIKLNTEHTNK